MKERSEAWLMGIGLLLVVPALNDGSGAHSEERASTTSGRVDALQRSFVAADWNAVIEEGTSLSEVSSELTERRNAEVHFAVGFARAMRAGEPQPAVAQPQPPAPGGAATEAPVLGADYSAAAEAFTSCRALAGPGRLRSYATYDRGTSTFLRGELWRATIPEIAQAAGQPQASPHGTPAVPGLPGAPGAPGAPDAEPPDPIEEARAAYLEAKADLTEALRADWRDENTRANLELIQRRLAELDRIEEERQQQEGEDPQDSSDDESQDGEEGEESEESGEDGEEERDPSEGDQEQEGNEEQQPEEQDPSEETPPDGEPETTENDVREGDELPEGEGEARSMAEPDAERHLTREEVIRLLDKLAEIEAEREAVTSARASGQRAKVDRDW